MSTNCLILLLVLACPLGVGRADILVPDSAETGFPLHEFDLDLLVKGDSTAKAKRETVRLGAVDVKLHVYPTFIRVLTKYALTSLIDHTTVHAIALPVRSYRARLRGVPLEELEVEVDGEPARSLRLKRERICSSGRFPEAGTLMANPADICRGRSFETRWWTWDVAVPPRATVRVEVQYLQFMSDGGPHGGQLYGRIHQFLGTAASWGHPIRRLTVSVELNAISEEELWLDDARPVREGNVLTWTFMDYVPTGRDGVAFGVRVNAATMGDRGVYSNYLPKDADQRLKLQDYLVRFGTMLGPPRPSDWSWLIDELKGLQAHAVSAVSRAWAYYVLRDLHDWAAEALERREGYQGIEPELEEEQEEPERVLYEEAPSSSPEDEVVIHGGDLKGLVQALEDPGLIVSPEAAPTKPPHTYSEAARRVLNWLEPEGQDPAARNVSLVKPISLRRVRAFQAYAWKGDYIVTLLAASEARHDTWVRSMWIAGAAFVCLVGWVSWRRRRA